MAEILALGISHYPPLIGTDDRMSMILRRMLQNPDLPPALRDPSGWPAEMRAEWGGDQVSALPAESSVPEKGSGEDVAAKGDDKTGEVVKLDLFRKK